MHIKTLAAYSCIFLYNPRILLYLNKYLSLLKQPSLYENYCINRLRRIIYHSYRRAPYYNDIFSKSGLVVNGKIQLDQFQQIPILTKAIIRQRMDALQSTPKNMKTYINTSGGSTGEPVQFVQDKQYYTQMVADTLLFSCLNGKHPGQKELKIWGSERDIFEGTVGAREKIMNFLFNRRFLNSFRLTHALIENYIATIQKQKPFQIWTYTDSIYEIAKYINKNDIRVFSPQNIICTAGTLYPEMRLEIQNAFPKSHVINQYGSREVGQIGCQTIDNDDMMIFLHANYVELVDPDSLEIIDEPYRPGKILVTNLNNYSMPLIRFDIGDMAEYAPKNRTGTLFTHFARLHGRENTHLINKNGDRIHGEYFTHLFYNKTWVQQFQVIQKNDAQIEILFVSHKKNPMLSKDFDDIENKIKCVMGNHVHVDFIRVNEINKLASGKYQFVRREFS